MANQSIRLKIRTREKLLLDEDVWAITSNNKRGVFDVLPEHANFISLIKDYLIIHKTNGSKDEMKLEIGLMEVSNNEIKIFLGLNYGVKSSTS